MIIPSIDLLGGETVQLERGRDLKLRAGDPRPFAKHFGRVGEVAVVDLDAALGQGSNAELIRELLPLAACRVGGGIRDLEAARRWLDAGAVKVVLGTAARPELLGALPPDRVVAALDARDGRVVIEGWRTETGADVRDRIRALAPYVGEFLVTCVEREGTLGGANLELAAELKELAGDRRLTFAGGVCRPEEIAALDRLGVDAQIGMALYTGRFDLADALAALLISDRPDGLWPTVVVDPSGVALGLAYSNLASLRAALRDGCGVYWSRTRGLWRKGATSGAEQTLLRVALDCDRDTLCFTVEQQSPGFCHLGAYSCWGEPPGLGALERRLARPATAARCSESAQSSPAFGEPGTPAGSLETSRPARASAAAGSYTARLLDDPVLLADKLREEAAELAAAETRAAIIAEAADLLYFTLVRLKAAEISLVDVERELTGRGRRLTRRGGDRKTAPTPGEPA